MTPKYIPLTFILILFHWIALPQHSPVKPLMGGDMSQNATGRIVSPSTVSGEGTLPVIYTLFDDDGRLSKFYTSELQVQSSIFPAAPTIMVNCGSGSASLDYVADNDFEITINGTSRVITVRQNWPTISYEGEITTSEVWDDSIIRQITNDLVIAAGVTLTIGAGSKIVLDEDVNIIVHGQLIVHGTAESPVVFTNHAAGTAWGGIRLSHATTGSSFVHTIFTGGGGNEDYVFGHSNSQAVVFSIGTGLNFNNCYFIDNPGKGIGGVACQISITNSVFNRCDMGAEFQSCVVNIDDSHFSEIPDGDGIPEDDDNDCLYFYHYLNTMPDSPTVVSNSVFCIGEDDAIDHNEAKLIIENCFINGFENEGIAASAGNYVQVFNSLIMNCEQGIEAGYGSPEVFVDHCVVLNCDAGIRFGDWYNWGCTGQMHIENTILYNNADNVLNFDVLTQDSVANAIMISHSITNDDYYDNYPFCFAAIPLFLPNYYLQADSPGVGQGSGQCDIGLYRCNTALHDFTQEHKAYTIFPNPTSHMLHITGPDLAFQEVIVSAYSMNGTHVFTKKFPAGRERIQIDLSELLPDSKVYFLRIEDGSQAASWHKVVFVK